MPYTIYIERGTGKTIKEWEPIPIPLDEWKAYVASDSELLQDIFVKGTTPHGAKVRYADLGHAVWTLYSRHGDGGEMAWFDWLDGRIEVRNADDEIREKAKKIAAHFGASVFSRY